MCNPIAAVMAVSAAVQVRGQIYGARSQKKQAESDAAARELAAEQIEDSAEMYSGQVRDESKQKAELIRKAARDIRGATKTAYAGAGVRVGQGSARVADEAIVRDSEQDAAMQILAGKRQSDSITLQAINDANALRVGAANARSAGKQAMTAGYIGAAGTVLGTAASYMRWDSMMKTKGKT